MTNVLEDAKVYLKHAQKKEVDISDVNLAVETRVDHSFTSPPPKEVRAATATGASNNNIYNRFTKGGI